MQMNSNGDWIEENPEQYPRTRSLAREMGDNKYFTGKACINGHICPRFVPSAVCISCHRKKRIKDRADNPEKRRSRERVRIRIARNNARIASAGRPVSLACECCGSGDRKLLWDHCHKGNHFRGWICMECNFILGMASDSVDVLKFCIDYLQRDKAKMTYMSKSDRADLVGRSLEFINLTKKATRKVQNDKK